MYVMLDSLVLVWLAVMLGQLVEKFASLKVEAARKGVWGLDEKKTGAQRTTLLRGTIGTICNMSIKSNSGLQFT
jgi:hypothetical protein